MRRDATWRDATRYDATFKYCSHYVWTSSRAVTWQQGIWDPEQIKLSNLNGCFDPTWHCVYLTDIPPKITSIRITQQHKHITWNTNSSHWWVLIKVCWGVNPGCVNSTSHVTLKQATILGNGFLWWRKPRESRLLCDSARLFGYRSQFGRRSRVTSRRA